MEKDGMGDHAGKRVRWRQNRIEGEVERLGKRP